MKKYSKQYDAYYNSESGEWLESNCGDIECEYCKDRPEKAFYMANLHNNENKNG